MKKIIILSIMMIGAISMSACSKKNEKDSPVEKSEVTTANVENTSEIDDIEAADTPSETLSETVETITPTPTTTPEATTTPQPTTQAYTVTKLDKTMYAKSSVNVRKGPSADFERLGSLNANQQVKVTGKSDQTGWFRIEFNGSEAYVSNNYL